MQIFLSSIFQEWRILRSHQLVLRRLITLRSIPKRKLVPVISFLFDCRRWLFLLSLYLIWFECQVLWIRLECNLRACDLGGPRTVSKYWLSIWRYRDWPHEACSLLRGNLIYYFVSFYSFHLYLSLKGAETRPHYLNYRFSTFIVTVRVLWGRSWIYWK